jgi:hypothetical protein
MVILQAFLLEENPNWRRNVDAIATHPPQTQRQRYSYWHIIDIVGRTPDAEKGRAFRYSSKAAKRTTGKARSAEATQIAAGEPGNDLPFSTNVKVGTDLGINAQDCANRPSRTGPLIFTQHS